MCVYVNTNRLYMISYHPLQLLSSHFHLLYSILCFFFQKKIDVFHLNNNEHLPWDTRARPPCRIRSRRISAVRKSEPREIHLKFHGDTPENWDQSLQMP